MIPDLEPAPGVELPTAPPAPPSEGAGGDGYASAVLSAASPHPLGDRSARRLRRRKARRQQVAGGAVAAGLVIVMSASNVGSLDMALPVLPTSVELPVEPAPSEQSLPAEDVDVCAPIPASAEPLIQVAGGSWRVVWALSPADPGAAAGLWPGTPWPGNPGRSVIGVAAVLDAVEAGSAFSLDDGWWVVYEVRVVDPEDWETLVEQPVEAAEVLVYELVDTPGRGRAALLARPGGAR